MVSFVLQSYTLISRLPRKLIERRCIILLKMIERILPYCMIAQQTFTFTPALFLLIDNKKLSINFCIAAYINYKAVVWLM